MTTALLPKEHGAYGQISFPLLTALVVSGVSAGGALVVLAAIAGFLAHEPASVLLGLRGIRARRELGDRAVRWFAGCAAVLALAGAGAWAVFPEGARWSLLVPLVPALFLATATARGVERTAFGEIAAALAFSSAALPVTLAAGAPARIGLAVAIPFALLFASTTLAVRVVILRVRGGGDRRATAATQRAVYAIAGGGAAALVALAAANALPASVLVAAAPGLLTGAIVSANPPPPSRLRRLGWTLVTVSVLTAVLVIAAALPLA